MRCPSCSHENISGEDRCAQCLHTLHHVRLPKKKEDTIKDAMMSAPISELITGEDLLVAAPSDRIDKVVKIFQDQNKNCVVVYQNQKLVGILSNRDLLWKVAGQYKDLSKVTVEDVMTPNPEYVKPDDPIAFVVNKMAMGGFRHVPVTDDDGKPVSIILIKDVLAYLANRKHRPSDKEELAASKYKTEALPKPRPAKKNLKKKK